MTAELEPAALSGGRDFRTTAPIRSRLPTCHRPDPPGGSREEYRCARPISPRRPRRRGTHHRARHGLGAGTLASGGGTVLAANPNWVVGHGTDSTPTAPQPARARRRPRSAAGKQVGFFEWLRNGDTSNISQLYLTASTTPSATLAGASWTIKDAAGATVRSGVCPHRDPADCSFGALSAGQHGLSSSPHSRTRSSLADGAHAGGPLRVQHHGTPRAAKQQPRRREGDRRPGRRSPATATPAATSTSTRPA